MRTLSILAFFLISHSCFSQQPKSIKGQTTEKLLKNDSVVEKLNRMQDSLRKDQEQKRWAETNSRNLNNLSRQLEERRKKEKKAAMIRIAIGIALFIVLIVGLLRRRAVKK